MVSDTMSDFALTTGQQEFLPNRDGLMFMSSTDTMSWSTPSIFAPTTMPPIIDHRRAIVKSNPSTQHEHCSGHQIHQFNRYAVPQAFQGYNRPPIQHNQPMLDTGSYHSHQAWISSPVNGHDRILPGTRHQISPPPGFPIPPLPERMNTSSLQEDPHTEPSQLLPSMNEAASEFGHIQASSASSPTKFDIPWSTGSADDDNSTSDSDNDSTNTHPNKYPVEIEYHDNRFCSYKRQATRSGEKIKQKFVTFHDSITLEPQTSLQQTKYYIKHLVRICCCGKYQVMDGALDQGRANDCDGYEIHYSQKCKWKAYDDFKTGRRVLIRLCKCYKPA